MAVSDKFRPVGRRRLLRWGTLVLLLVGAAAAAAVIWAWPTEAWDRGSRVLATWGLTMATGLGLLFWLVVLSGLRWYVSGALIVALAIAVPCTVRLRGFTGDMIPIVNWRWQMTADDLLEADRARQGRASQLGPIQLSADSNLCFPEFRGLHRNGVVAGPPLARDWSTHPPRQSWREPVGGGYSGIAVSGNIAITLEQRRDKEVVACYDTATGKERWTYSYPARFSETLGGDGPRATPTIAGEDVYSLGATGTLVCLDVHTGKPRWTTNILEPNNTNVRWGMSGSPLVVGQEVLVAPGVQKPDVDGGTLTAFARATGKPRWSAGRALAGYSSPMLASLAGTRQIILFDGEGVAGYDLDKHRELWRYGWLTQEHINVAEPLVFDGDRILISSGYGVGCAMLQVMKTGDRWSVKPLWKKRTLRSKFNNPVVRDGFVYGLDDGILVCLDIQTGERKWRGPRFGHGQLLLTGDLLVILSEEGQLALAEAIPDGYREHGRLDVLQGKTWNCPALADGKLYIRNDHEMACYDLRAETAPAAGEGSR